MSSRKGSVRDRGTKRKSVPRNTRTAYHEAGHAVMASLMDIPFESISVMFGKDDDFEGCFQIHEGEEKRVEHLDPGEKRAIIEKYVMVALAGELSEFLLTGRHSMRDSLSDYLKAYKLVFDLHPHGEIRSRRPGDRAVHRLALREVQEHPEDTPHLASGRGARQ